jgi:hypothetical protein
MHTSIRLGIIVMLFALGPLALAGEDGVQESGKGKAVSRAALLTIYAHWFEKPYEYMFDSDGASTTVRGKSYGMLKGGINGILKYGALTDAVAKHLKQRSPSFGDLRPIAKLAGLEIQARGETEGLPFGRYNAAIIRWGYQNLIPSPNDQVAGLKCQALYDGVFQRFFRLTADAYLYLDKGKLWDKERAAYQKAMKRPRFDGINYLQGRYGNALPGYTLSQDGTAFTAPMGIGFWLRRKMDGTAGEVWTGLGKLMALYDAAWMATRAKK